MINLTKKKEASLPGVEEMLYVWLQPHIRLAYYNDSLILLDLLKNKYTILKKSFSKRLIKALKTKMDNSSKNDSFIYLLRKLNIINKKFYTTSQVLPKEFISDGVGEITWFIDRESLNKLVSKSLVIKAFFILLKVDFYLKTNQFYRLIKSLKKIKPIKNKTYSIDELVCVLNKACYYYFSRVKCLEWSFALTFLARKFNINCNLAIGVQNYPFTSHAWVEHEGKVIADDQELIQKMTVILREPV